MKDNKHPHHDLIAEWIKDTSKEVQIKTKSNAFICRSIKEVIGDKKGVCEFRIKPREFTKGHWYPCVFKCGDDSFIRWDGEKFHDADVEYHRGSNFRWIGESLGEIKFR